MRDKEMNKIDLRMKILIPIAVVFALLVSVSAFWIAHQTQTLSEEFRNQLAILAMTSRFTIHSSAAEFVTSRGLTFHRILNESNTNENVQTALVNEARRAFESDGKLEVFTKEIAENGVSRLYAFSPARIQDECRMCHNQNGVNLFADKKNGDMVAIYGVSGSTEAIESSSNHLWLIIFGVVLFSFLVIAISVFIISDKVIYKPLKEILASSEIVAQGNLTVKIPTESHGEIGKLGEAFNSMVANIDATLSEVSQAMDAVASSTVQMASSTEQMATGTQEQSAQTEDVATSMDEMSHTITENARNASILADTVRESKNAADQGGEAVKNTIASVRNIGSTVQNFTSSILSLRSSSDQIGEIVNVINDIADQTNLLALNAAIEAARAGDQGRGFAVVADEVRKLAERTVKATKEIEMKIKRIQEDSASAASNLENGINAVENGIEQAEQAGIMLDGIVEISGAVVDVVSQMATSSEEQSATGEGIAKNVQAISTVVHQTSNGVKEMAHTTEELTQLSARVMDLLSKFKISSGERQPNSYPSDSKSTLKYSKEQSKRGRLLTAAEQRKLIKHDTLLEV